MAHVNLGGTSGAPVAPRAGRLRGQALLPAGREHARVRCARPLPAAAYEHVDESTSWSVLFTSPVSGPRRSSQVRDQAPDVRRPRVGVHGDTVTGTYRAGTA